MKVKPIPFFYSQQEIYLLRHLQNLYSIICADFFYLFWSKVVKCVDILFKVKKHDQCRQSLPLFGKKQIQTYLYLLKQKAKATTATTTSKICIFVTEKQYFRTLCTWVFKLFRFALFSFFPQRESSFFPVAWTGRKHSMTIFPFHLQTTYTDLIPTLLVHLLQAKWVRMIKKWLRKCG